MITLFRDLFAPPRHMILLVIAAWIGLTFSEKHADDHGINKDDLNNIAFYGLIAFIIGGRISYVLQNIPTFIQSPLGIISINPDIFDPIGALAAALLVGFIYGQRHNLSFWHALDALTPFLAVITIGLGLSHLAAGTAFGKETDLPWGINLWNATRHPTQIYEALASSLTFTLLWFKRPNSGSGILFLTFVALTAGSQLFIQGFREDSTLSFNGINQSQLIAWGLLGITFLLIENRLKQKS